MVFPNEATKILKEKYANFEKHDSYLECLERYKDGDISFCGIMNAFTDYVVDSYIKCENKEKLKVIFEVIESFMKNGDNKVKDAAATCFLENLINISSHGDFDTSMFIYYLGPESKAYCKAWDEFTGVKTPGLWDE
jgi:hypothetical protein